MGKVEQQCPPCYRRLPLPQDMLGPCDSELSYAIWSPGFKWKPEPIESDEGGLESIKERDEAQYDDDMREAEQEALEASEDKKKFSAINGGSPITVDQAACLARQLGMSPSYNDMQKFEEKFGKELDWPLFAKFRATLLHPEDKLDDFVSVFVHYDSANTGKLSKKQMRNILSTFGEPLNEREADAMLEKFCQGAEVDYRSFCEQILARG